MKREGMRGMWPRGMLKIPKKTQQPQPEDLDTQLSQHEDHDPRPCSHDTRPRSHDSQPQHEDHETQPQQDSETLLSYISKSKLIN